MRKIVTISSQVCFFLSCLFFTLNGWSQEKTSLKELPAVERFEVMKKQYESLKKALQQDPEHADQKFTTIEGNEIKVLLTNLGSISTPDADLSDADLFWPKGVGLGYAYEFGPLVAVEVPHAFIDDTVIHIVDDGFLTVADGDFRTGTDIKRGWLPKVGFSDPNSNEMARLTDLDDDLDGKPDSWPEQYFNPTLGRYVWPAFLGDDAAAPDEEVFYVMDDFSNDEFDYYPFPEDSSKRGVGLELEVRIFQFNNALAEDLIFLVYTITNVSSKTLDKVYLGMFGDPHVGGPGDFSDDNANFISAFDESFPFDTRNMLYAFDADSRGDGGLTPGYFGYRFMESPGLDNDGLDNDNDGLVDESPFNDAGTEIIGPIGIFGEEKLHWSGDEDGDWLVEFDDVGVDGIPNTADPGEGDGKPTQLFYLDANGNSILDVGEATSETRLEGMRFFGGEPNFGFLDTAESDQLGLTSFSAILFGGNNRPKNDELMWQIMSTGNQRPEDPEPEIEQESDNVFIYGSGPFSLAPGESQRFSIALVLGVDLDDLLQNAEISQQVFESDYRFAQPPLKPIVKAVPGDKKVTLYWDTRAESSFDQFISRANPDNPSEGFDFEGYRIYRSRDFSFNDTKSITNSRGIPFLSEPLKQANGVTAQWDLVNDFSGLSDIEFPGGVRFDLGSNTGLVHSFVDSNDVLNGVTYFYAITSYDHGDAEAGIVPSESQRTIDQDALTREFTFDVNTALIVPGPPAKGTVDPDLDNDILGQNLAAQETGNATGTVSIKFLDPFAVRDKAKYDIEFLDVNIDSFTTATGYSVTDTETKTDTVTSRGIFFVTLKLKNLVENTVTVRNLSNGGIVDPADYEVDLIEGRLRGTSSGSLPEGQKIEVSYLFKPVSESVALNSEDSNPVFDGMRMFVQDEETAPNAQKSGFKIKNSTTNFELEFLKLSSLGNPKATDTDFELRFVDYDTTADGNLVAPADTSILRPVETPFVLIDLSTDLPIDFFISENVSGFQNGRWDYVESINFIKPGTQNQTTYEIKFTPPVDTLEAADGTDSLLVADPVYPGNGDVFLVFSNKPFESGDKYSITTNATSFSTQIAQEALQDVIVVPNPYVAFSAAELRFRSGIRNDRIMEFRNLPQKCTIRIYTITGELVDTIIKDDNTNSAVWDLLTFESQRTAYGVYLYHIDAPGVGTKTGRLALIK